MVEISRVLDCFLDLQVYCDIEELCTKFGENPGWFDPLFGTFGVGRGKAGPTLAMW